MAEENKAPSISNGSEDSLQGSRFAAKVSSGDLLGRYLAGDNTLTEDELISIGKRVAAVDKTPDGGMKVKLQSGSTLTFTPGAPERITYKSQSNEFTQDSADEIIAGGVLRGWTSFELTGTEDQQKMMLASIVKENDKKQAIFLQAQAEGKIPAEEIFDPPFKLKGSKAALVSPPPLKAGAPVQADSGTSLGKGAGTPKREGRLQSIGKVFSGMTVVGVATMAAKCAAVFAIKYYAPIAAVTFGGAAGPILAAAVPLLFAGWSAYKLGKAAMAMKKKADEIQQKQGGKGISKTKAFLIAMKENKFKAGMLVGGIIMSAVAGAGHLDSFADSIVDNISDAPDVTSVDVTSQAMFEDGVNINAGNAGHALPADELADLNVGNAGHMSPEDLKILAETDPEGAETIAKLQAEMPELEQEAAKNVAMLNEQNDAMAAELNEEIKGLEIDFSEIDAKTDADLAQLEATTNENLAQMDAMSARLDAQSAEIVDNFNPEQDTSGIDAQMAAEEAKFNASMDKIGTKMDGMNARLDAQSAEIVDNFNPEQDYSELDAKMDAADAKLNASMEKAGERLDGMNARLDAQSAEIVDNFNPEQDYSELDAKMDAADAKLNTSMEKAGERLDEISSNQDAQIAEIADNPVVDSNETAGGVSETTVEVSDNGTTTTTKTSGWVVGNPDDATVEDLKVQAPEDVKVEAPKDSLKGKTVADLFFESDPEDVKAADEFGKDFFETEESKAFEKSIDDSNARTSQMQVDQAHVEFKDMSNTELYEILTPDQLEEANRQTDNLHANMMNQVESISPRMLENFYGRGGPELLKDIKLFKAFDGQVDALTENIDQYENYMEETLKDVPEGQKASVRAQLEANENYIEQVNARNAYGMEMAALEDEMSERGFPTRDQLHKQAMIEVGELNGQSFDGKVEATYQIKSTLKDMVGSNEPERVSMKLPEGKPQAIQPKPLKMG